MTGAVVALAEPQALPSPGGSRLRCPPGTIPDNQNPYLAYLATLGSDSSIRTMAGALDRLAVIIAQDGITDSGNGATLAWWELRAGDVAIIKGHLTRAGRAPADVNKHLSALRRVLRMCWLLGLMDADEYQRAKEVDNVRGSRLKSGRTVGEEEIAAMLRECLHDAYGTHTPECGNRRADMTDKHKAALKALGLRDAALIVTLASTGVRPAEAAALNVEDMDTALRRLKVIGKGNKQRVVFFHPVAVGYVNTWLAHACLSSGAAFPALGRWGHARPGHMTPENVGNVITARYEAAKLRKLTPRDLRKTFASDLIGQVDIVRVQMILGHASPVTTQQNYDLRDEALLRDATDMLTILTRPEDLDAVVQGAAATAWPGTEA